MYLIFAQFRFNLAELDYVFSQVNEIRLKSLLSLLSGLGLWMLSWYETPIAVLESAELSYSVANDLHLRLL